jgi:signal transduction histidine kinase
MSKGLRASTRLVAFCTALVSACAPALAADPLPRSVLYLDENDPGLPFASSLAGAFRATINAGHTERIAVFSENLDLVRSRGPRHEEILKTYLREKYRDTPIGVLTTVGPAALTFMLRARSELWPQIPAIFASVDPDTAAGAKLPAGVTGLVRRQTLRDSVNVARTLVPTIGKIALVGDVLDRQNFRRHFKEEIPTLASDIEIIDLTGLPMAELRRRVAMLPRDAIIYFTTLTFDGDRAAYISRDALVSILEVANRPIVVDLDTNVGFGSLGGLVADPVPIGSEAAKVALRILNGETNIPVVMGNFVTPVFDWRALQRWGIGENKVPPGSVLRFRQPTAWEQYQWQIIVIAAAFLLQSAMMTGLFLEHRRRLSAEALARRTMGELANMNRVATAGKLSASIAHEVNQPLAAMVTNANAGLRFLTRPAPDIDSTRAALERVVKDGHRAGDVIKSIRAMFNKEEKDRAWLDINEVVRDVLVLLQGELQAQRIVVRDDLGRQLPLVQGHKGQLQQVILNLVRNAADAMSQISDRARVLRVSSQREPPNDVLVSIEDSGTGIDPKHADRLFDAFFTTKSNGMGMGLAICRSIVEAHSGRLWATSDLNHGAVFHIALPAGEATQV